MPAMSAAGTATVGVYWGGIGGAVLGTFAPVGTAIVNGDFPAAVWADADLYWESNSAVSVTAVVTYLLPSGTIGNNFGSLSTVVTGLTTTSDKALTFGWTWNHAGSGTVQPLTAYAMQVH